MSFWQVDCYDYDSDGSHDFIGTFSTTGTEIMKAIDQQVKGITVLKEYFTA